MDCSHREVPQHKVWERYQRSSLHSDIEREAGKILLKITKFLYKSFRYAVVIDIKNGGEWWSLPVTVQGLRVISRNSVSTSSM